MPINHDDEYYTEHPWPKDVYFMESEDSENNSISMDISKTLESNKELLEHPFYN